MCPECTKKVEEGDVKQCELDMVRAVEMCKPEFKSLRKLEMEKVFDLGEVTFVIVPKHHGGKIIGKDAQVITALCEVTQRRLRILERGTDDHKIIQAVISPVKLLGVNVTYTKEGETFKIRVPKHELKKLPMPKEKATETISMFTGKEAEIKGE